MPNLTSTDLQNSTHSQGVTLVVYAPFGTDKVLSTFPNGESAELAQHPLFKNLLKVSETGVNITALMDLENDETYLVQIPAGRPADIEVISQWKQQMDSPYTLAGLLRQAHRAHPETSLVLCLEGHGAGFLPDIDRRQLTAANLTQPNISWHITPEHTAPTLPTGGPLLPTGGPLLPTGGPLLPVNHLPLSTYGLGAALKSAAHSGVPKLAVIHFNNCFNMSVEVLHTVAPYADYATGYLNYNFFTSGASYPEVFEQLAQAGHATSQQLSQWFADANHAALAAKGNHPTTGGVVKLARLHEIAERIDDLADALLSALRTATSRARPAVVSKIRHAILNAQQFDTESPMALEAPDQLTDIYSFATALLAFDFGSQKVHSAAMSLQEALKDIKRYGDNDIPWPAPEQRWDFSSPTLAMNIFLPDPLLTGLWDWRSPYYLDVNPDPALPQIQPNIIEFLKVTDWVDFIIEYHKEIKFVGLLPALIPEFPVFNATYEPPRSEEDDSDCKGGHRPSHEGNTKSN